MSCLISVELKAQCGSDTSTTIVISEVIMPSVFTPNFDGINECKIY